MPAIAHGVLVSSAACIFSLIADVGQFTNLDVLADGVKFRDLVVLAIISMLLTLAVPRFFSSVDTAKETILVENLLLTRETLDKFYADVGRYPDSLDELEQRQYLKDLPNDPLVDSRTAWVIVPPKVVIKMAKASWAFTVCRNRNP